MNHVPIGQEGWCGKTVDRCLTTQYAFHQTIKQFANDRADVKCLKLLVEGSCPEGKNDRHDDELHTAPP